MTSIEQCAELIHEAHSIPSSPVQEYRRRWGFRISAGRALGDVTTLADPSVIESLKKNYDES